MEFSEYGGIDDKGLISRYSRKNRPKRRSLLPICYQTSCLTKFFNRARADPWGVGPNLSASDLEIHNATHCLGSIGGYVTVDASSHCERHCEVVGSSSLYSDPNSGESESCFLRQAENRAGRAVEYMKNCEHTNLGRSNGHPHFGA